MRCFGILFVVCFLCQNVQGDWTALFPELEERRHFRTKREVASIHEIYIHELDVRTDIVARFSDTKVVSEIENRVYDSREIVFQTQLPNAAFISNFSMIIGGVEYVGIIKEKAAAQAEFEEAKNRGVSAGLVQTQQRETQWFKVSVNVESFQTVIFKLRYQQLLERKLGLYQQVVFADPSLTNVGRFLVKIFITEPTGIKSLNAMQPYTGTSDDSSQDGTFSLNLRRTRTRAVVTYYKTNFNPARESSRRFVVRYDVEHHLVAENVWRHNGYFVHFLAPTLDLLPKRVVFVVDTSGSMRGNKMTQTKAALNTIIPQLKPLDQYNIVTFESNVDEWQPTLKRANDSRKKAEALRFISNLRASGGTNFNGGVVTAINMLDDLALGDQTLGTSMIIVLTDGRPTAGETNLEKIKANIRTANTNKQSIFTLGFGADLDHNLLKQIAFENGGATRQIFEGLDATKQLQGFFEEVANPILQDITVTYNGRVSELTNNKFPVYYGGSEMVIMGKYTEGSHISARINAVGKDGKFSKTIASTDLDDLHPISAEITDDFEFFFERMWVYLSLSQLIKQEIVERDQNAAAYLKQSIIQKALQYNLVTPFTALIAKKPFGNDEAALISDKKPQEQKIRPPSVQPSQPQMQSSRAFIGGPASTSNFFFNGRGGPVFAASSSAGCCGGLTFDSDDAEADMEAPTTTTTTTTPKTTTTAQPTPSSHLNNAPDNPDNIIAPPCESKRVLYSKVTVFSKTFQNNYRCKWSITNYEDNKSLIFTFEKLDTEGDGKNCKNDRVVVYYSNNNNNNLWQKKIFCGYENFESFVVVAERQIVVVYETNDEISGEGFQANVELK